MPRQTSRRPERDDLTGEHALTDIGQLILLVLFAGAWIADTFFLRITTGLNALIPLWVRVPIGAVLLALAAYLGTSSHRIIFGTTRDKPHVLRTGVFSKVRHPMYCIWVSEAPNTSNFIRADHIHPESWEGSVDYAKQFVAWDRHEGTSNYLFVDGHAESLKFEHTYDWPHSCYWFPESAPKWPSDE